MGLAIGLRALDGLVSAFEVNEGIELLKTGVLMHDTQWFRTMWDDQPGTLMWILSWLFRLTDPDVAIGRWWVIGVTAALLTLLARSLEHRTGRGSSLALVPLLLADPTVFQLLGSVMLEPASIPFALAGALCFQNQLQAPRVAVSLLAGITTGVGLAIKLTALLPAQLAGWAYLLAVWEAGRTHPDPTARRRQLHCHAALYAGGAMSMCLLAYRLGDYDFRILGQSHVVGVLDSQPFWPQLPGAFRTSIGAWGVALPCVALLPTSLIFCRINRRLRTWILPWLATLVSTTVAFSIYPFWHNYYVIHFAVPLAAIGAPTIAQLARAAVRRAPPIRLLHPALGCAAIAAMAWVMSDSLSLFAKRSGGERAEALQEIRSLLTEYRSQVGTVFASTPHTYLFESGVLPVRGLEVVVEKRRQCGHLSPESALEILRSDPPGAIITDPMRTGLSIYSPFTRPFLESGYALILENGVGEVWIRNDVVTQTGLTRRPNRASRLIQELRL